MELRSANIIDPAIEGHYAYIPFAHQISTQLHYHDFYEIFLVVDGHIEHHINGQVDHLTRGALVFIRPDDTHRFRQAPHVGCVLINLAFLAETFDALVDFLGFREERIISPALPPQTLLDGTTSGALRYRLQDWGRSIYQDSDYAKRTLRALLAHMMSQFFLGDATHNTKPVPPWMQDVITAMQQPEHFVEGRAALMRLAQRTPAYVGRSFKAHLNTTPSAFINNLRLDHATDLLLQTDHSPTQIAYDVGFNNLSHFYYLFKARWDCSPNEFRKRHQWLATP